MTVLAKDGKTKIMDNLPRMGAGGDASKTGMGHRAVNPHTTQSFGRFSYCTKCHLKKDGSNQKQVEITWGLGSDRYLHVDGNGKTWRLDQLMTKDGKSIVSPGHDQPNVSRPIGKAMLDRLRKIKIP